MYQTFIIPIDHGNGNIKTSNLIYTSGLTESDNKPPFGEYLYYKQKYYTLTEQRIPYMRDKTIDERFFILTLFAIGMELEQKTKSPSKTIFEVELPIGLPPKHYGSLYKKFEAYFKREEIISFIYHEKEYNIYMNKVFAFPQDYAAAMTIYQEISNYSKVIVIDIGGFTLDYLLVKNGTADLSVCDSLENGVIKLYHIISSRINSEYDILLEDFDIDCILKKQMTQFSFAVIENVLNITQSFTEDLLGILRERGIDLKSLYTVFVGGGSLLLQPFLCTSNKIGTHFFIEDIRANAKGYNILYEIQKKAGMYHGQKK